MEPQEAAEELNTLSAVKRAAWLCGDYAGFEDAERKQGDIINEMRAKGWHAYHDFEADSWYLERRKERCQDQ